MPTGFCPRCLPPIPQRGYRDAMITRLTVPTTRQGLHEITRQVADVVSKAGVKSGLCTVFVQHTSASLIIQENADPSARHDLEAWLNRLVPEGDRQFTHTAEGSDDMPSHIKAALTATSLGVPIDGGKLCLGTWQGIYLWEHRRKPHERTIVVQVMGEAVM
jgi:secondary thiamine-phosphate synthase enzyme